MKPTFVRGHANALGDQGTLKQWSIKIYDEIYVGQMICTIVTPAKVFEVEASSSGTVVWLHDLGEVKPGEVIADVTPEGEEPNVLNVEHIFAPLEYDEE